MAVPEARIEQTDDGLAPTGPGWFVVNAREARWRHRPGRGNSLPFTGFTGEECESYFPQIGIALVVLGPGEPIGLYHWENDQEDFLVLAGEGVLVVEGEERPLRQWDFVHCPPGTQHMIVGAGKGCTVLGIGAREHGDEDCHGGAYTVDEVARRYGASVDEEKTDASRDYASMFGETAPTRYREEWLP
jgi:uncharacterized cupin superfamily protein